MSSSIAAQLAAHQNFLRSQMHFPMSTATASSATVVPTTGTYQIGLGTLTTSGTGNFIISNTSSANVMIGGSGGAGRWIDSDGVMWDSHPAKLQAGHSYKLPDGSTLKLDALGNPTILNASDKVTYRANSQREFNRFVNASDLVGLFIEDLAKAGARQDRALSVPIGVFINWLILKAADADGEPVPADVPRLETDANVAAIKATAPKCLHCGRFIPARNERARMPFCSGAHAQRHLESTS